MGVQDCKSAVSERSAVNNHIAPRLAKTQFWPVWVQYGYSEWIQVHGVFVYIIICRLRFCLCVVILCSSFSFESTF